MGPRQLWVIMVTIAVVATACAGAATPTGPTATGSITPTERQASAAIADAAIPGTYDPVEAGEPLPPDFRRVLGRDAILPVYAPTVVAASEVDWPGESLVIGVDLAGEARAYPVGFLTIREMVVDDHRGIPTLVTW